MAGHFIGMPYKQQQWEELKNAAKDDDTKLLLGVLQDLTAYLAAFGGDVQESLDELLPDQGEGGGFK
jgi:hypothetical protein